MRFAYALAIVALVGGVVAAVHGCSSQDCCGSCPADEPAIFHLSCTSADLTGVETTGPCERDAGLSLTRGDEAAWVGSVFVQGQSPGVCHVKLTFVTGFTYSADVTFATQSGGVCGGPQCKCGDILAPTSGPFTVDNPSDTCVAEPDSGEDSGGADVSVESTAGLYGPCDGGCADGSAEAASSDAGDASPDGGQAAACADRSTCASGEICCLVNALTNAVACRTAPCPTVPGLGVPIQLCSSPAECFAAGDTCAPFVAGAAGKVCSAPKDASGE